MINDKAEDQACVKTLTPVLIALPAAAPCLAISYVILFDGRYGKISTYAIKILKIVILRSAQ